MYRTKLAASLAAVLAVAALSACGGGAGQPGATTDAVEVADTETSTTVADGPITADGVVANSDGDLAIYSTTESTDPAMVLPAKTEFGSRRVVAVEAIHHDGEWLEVSLPERPNGSRGFVKAADVTLSEVDVRIDVDLTAKRLQLIAADGAVLLATDIAIGAPENPTPTGDFYVTDIISTGDPGSGYGLFALGLSGHSLQVTDFGGGDGQIGIHGTDQPSSIGQAVSHGCVRLTNDHIVTLANAAPLGTPVTIH